MTTKPPTPARRRAKPRPPGPFSRDISRVDRRGKAGRLVKETQAALIEHIGGSPSVAELLLIQSISLKVCRLHLLGEALLAGDPIDADHNSVLAWSNSLRLDLQAIGLEKRIFKVINAEGERLLDYFSKPPPATPPEPPR
jgi:hypothetical protein